MALTIEHPSKAQRGAVAKHFTKENKKLRKVVKRKAKADLPKPAESVINCMGRCLKGLSSTYSQAGVTLDRSLKQPKCWGARASSKGVTHTRVPNAV